MTIVATLNSTAEETISQSRDYWSAVFLSFGPPGDHYEVFYIDPATLPDVYDQIEINSLEVEYLTQDVTDKFRKVSVNATGIIPSEIQVDSRVSSLVNSLFRSSVGASSDESEQSGFTTELAELIHRHDIPAVKLIEDYMYNEQVESELAWIALQEIGRIDDAVTHNFRMWILTQGLRAKSHWYRDGSALGLYNLMDPGAIPYLKNAENVEVYEELKRTYGKIVKHMEQTLM